MQLTFYPEPGDFFVATGDTYENVKIIQIEAYLTTNKISLLVSHNQTVGNYRELLLRNLLKKHLPSKFSIATGFIQGS